MNSYININISTNGTQTFSINGKKVTVVIKEPTFTKGTVMYTVNNNRIKVNEVITREEANKITNNRFVNRCFDNNRVFMVDHNNNVSVYEESNLERYVNRKQGFFKSYDEAVNKILNSLSNSNQRNIRSLNYYKQRRNNG
jgi:hypothetical protein